MQPVQDPHNFEVMPQFSPFAIVFCQGVTYVHFLKSLLVQAQVMFLFTNPWNSRLNQTKKNEVFIYSFSELPCIP